MYIGNNPFSVELVKIYIYIGVSPSNKINKFQLCATIGQLMPWPGSSVG